MNIVLASASPRRKELLSNLNLDFKIIKSDIEEFVNDKDIPTSVAMRLIISKGN